MIFSARIINQSKSHVSFYLFIDGANVSEYVCMRINEFEEFRNKLDLQIKTYGADDGL